MSHLFALFLITSIANIITPGLGVAMIVMLAAAQGWRRTLWGCLGIALGIAILFAAALSGIGVIVAASPKLFSAIKLAGAVYIFWLAWRTWRKPPLAFSSLEAAESAESAGAAGKPGRFGMPAESARGQFARCIFISLTNPQPLVFGVSVLPQFIDPTLPYAPQCVLMITVYAALVFVCMVAYALAASRAREFLARGNGPLWLKRASAAVFLAIGLAVLYAAVAGWRAAG